MKKDGVEHANEFARGLRELYIDLIQKYNLAMNAAKRFGDKSDEEIAIMGTAWLLDKMENYDSEYATSLQSIPRHMRKVALLVFHETMLTEMEKVRTAQN